MSILIKGMEMPFCCLVCPCSGTDNADDGNEVWICEASKLRQFTTKDKIERRPEWCPLVPVPKHGRLIDADALYEVVKKRTKNWAGGWNDIECVLTGNDIKNAPTIIPADPAEEGKT